MNTPRLSVILLSLNGGVSVKKVIRRLSTLVCADQMEIVLGIGDMPLAIEPPTCFAGFRVVHTAVSEDIGKARAAAIRAAAAPIVVLGEDHSFPTEGWAQALLAEFESGVAGVGPRILNGNPATNASWCDAILCYGSFLQPAGARPATHIPWHNSAYRREILLSFGDRLDFLLQADSALQSALARQGYRFSMAAQASTEHWNSSVLRHQLIALFWGNRLYAANRATLDNWGFPRRLLYAISWPAIAALRLWRACRICFSLGDRRLRYSTLLPVLAAGACVAAAGEACGHLFGLGPHTLRRRCHYELNRTLHVTPSEVAMLAE